MNRYNYLEGWRKPTYEHKYTIGSKWRNKPPDHNTYEIADIDFDNRGRPLYYIVVGPKDKHTNRYTKSDLVHESYMEREMNPTS